MITPVEIAWCVNNLAALMESVDRLLFLPPHYLHYDEEDHSTETRCIYCGNFVHSLDCRWLQLRDLHDKINKDLEGSWRT